MRIIDSEMANKCIGKVCGYDSNVSLKVNQNY